MEGYSAIIILTCFLIVGLVAFGVYIAMHIRHCDTHIKRMQTWFTLADLTSTGFIEPICISRIIFFLNEKLLDIRPSDGLEHNARTDLLEKINRRKWRLLSYEDLRKCHFLYDRVGTFRPRSGTYDDGSTLP